MTWAERVATQIRSADDTQRIENQRVAEEHRLRRALAPDYWSKLREKLKLSCEELRQQLGREVLQFQVRPINEAWVVKVTYPHATLKVEFDQEALRVRYSCGSGVGEFTFQIEPDSTVIFCDPDRRPYTVDELAEHLLDLVLGQMSCSFLSRQI